MDVGINSMPIGILSLGAVKTETVLSANSSTGIQHSGENSTGLEAQVWSSTAVRRPSGQGALSGWTALLYLLCSREMSLVFQPSQGTTVFTFHEKRKYPLCVRGELTYIERSPHP